MRNRYFKRILSLAMSLAIVLSLCLTAQAKNSITVILDGHPIELSAPAYIDKNDRTQVPVTIGPQLGITYHEGNGEVTFIKGEKSLTFRNGEKSAGSTAMDTAANLSGKVGYVPLAYLAQFFGYRVAWSASNNTVTLTKAPELTVDDIKNIQAYSELTYYAVAVTRVDITYKDGVDVSDVQASDYHLIDRGYLYPDFGELPIEDVDVHGQVVTLTIDRDTTANDENAYIYAGVNATGNRAKDDVYGTHATFSWYRENDGDIVEAARAFQYRDTELKLWHEGESEEDALCQADEKGNYISGGKWGPTEIEYFTDVSTGSFTKNNKTHLYTKGGFMTLEELGIQIPSSSVIEGDYVMAYAAFPDGYDPNKEYPLILSLPGNSAAMWDIMENGEIVATNPYGATFFNGSVINWYDKGVDAIVVYMSHRYYSDFVNSVSDATKLNEEGYNYAKDNIALIDYFVENYGAKENHVILTGDSRGTMAGSDIIKAYPGRISTFLCINGDWGVKSSPYTVEDYATAAENGLSVWCIDGEQDTNNIDVIKQARELYAEAGYTETEINDMVRHSGIATDYNYYWGETDHSATKFVYWYLMDTIYHGPGHIENGTIVYDNPNSTSYELNGTLGENGIYLKKGYSYPVYADTLIDWVMSTDREIEVKK